MFLGNSRRAPSGKVRVILFTGSTGFRFAEAVLESGFGFAGRSWFSPWAHSCERAQVSGKQRYSRRFGRCNRGVSRKLGSTGQVGRAFDALGSATAAEIEQFREKKSHPPVAAAWTWHHRLVSILTVLLPSFSRHTAVMPLRALLVAFLVLMFAPAQAATAARPRPVAPPAPMMFYVVKGAPDACGRGCDRWIAVEGQVDGTRPRVSGEFLSRVKIATCRSISLRPAAISTRRWQWARCCASAPRRRGWRAPWCGNAVSRRRTGSARTARSASS